MLTNKTYLLLLFFGLLVSCQPKEKFDWEIGVSAPKYYSSIPSVSFYNNGKIVHHVSTDFGIDPGWGETSGGYASGKENDEVPDSLVVKWDCGVDMIGYELKTKLPRQKMLQLFQNPVTNIDGTVRPYSLIIVGTAPGGNVAVWMRAESVLTEVGRFKAKEVNKIDLFDKNRVTLWTSTGEAAKENLIYLNLKGIPYSVWEKGEKKYDYDIGFVSEDNTSRINILTFYTKSGVVFQPDTFSGSPITIDKSSWALSNYSSNNNKVKENPLPVMMKVEIEDLKDPTVYHSTFVVLPNDFEELYKQKYLDPDTGKKENFNRIIIGIKSGENFGIIWLEGKNKRIKVMEFKSFPSKMNGTTYEAGGYSLPKEFSFPKWEGREKLMQPDTEFWQEK